MAAFAAASFYAASAQATQPLEEFLAHAKNENFDSREKRAETAQREWEESAALGRLLPSFTARGVYQFNEYEVSAQLPGMPEALVITPKHQLDAILQLDIPIIDLSSYHRYQQSKHFADATALQEALVGTAVDRAVSRAYYSFVGASALADAAERNLQMAEANLSFVDARHEAGAALELDLERAKANLARSKQDVADAELMRTLASRTLETLSGLSPTPVAHFTEDDLRGEGSLADWLSVTDTPSARVQAKLSEAAASGRRASGSALLPTLSANAQERFTNATGFAGRSSVYALQAVLSWRLDYGTYANAKAQSAQAELQRIREAKELRSTEDSIFEAYQRVEAGIAKSQAARAQAEAAKKAADLATERYRAGASTQLDVTQAQRDAFQAEAMRIQADADLEYARVSLRVAAGKPPTQPPVGAPRLLSPETSSTAGVR